MKVLVTGAFGNLGAMCVEQALTLGYQVKCFDIKSDQNEKLARQLLQKLRRTEGVEVIWGDIRNVENIPNLLSDVDGIIHNASLLPPLTEQQPQLAKSINVTATEQLIRLAQAQTQPIRFIFPSSVTVFGLAYSDENPKTPEDKTQATDQYTSHKLQCEAALKQSTLPWSILRVGVSVDHRTTKTDLKTLTTLLRINPNNPLEYVHPKDVALAMCQAIACDNAIGKTLLIGGGQHCQITQSEFMNASLKGLGLTLKEKSFGVNSYYTHWMDTSESQALLNYQKHSFTDYQQEMAKTFKTLYTILTPVRPLANWVLNRLVSRLNKI